VLNITGAGVLIDMYGCNVSNCESENILYACFNQGANQDEPKYLCIHLSNY